MKLPQRGKNGKIDTLELGGKQRVLIVGANGAGKTRFSNALAALGGDKTYQLNALHALFDRHADTSTLSPALQRRLSPSLPQGGNMTELEILLAQLMQDEMINLIGYKLAIADGRKATLRPTGLDRVVTLWQEVFPGNRVLIDSGKILFSRGIDASTYSAVRLSDGERAVLYYASAVHYAPKGAFIFVEAPEIFLHPTLTSALWNRLEAWRNDCTFIYTTHDPEFASSRNGAPVVWVRSYDSSSETWEYDILPPDKGISQELYRTLIGARKPVLFIEGDSERSIDAKLYPLIFPDFTVRSLGSCNKVIEATRTFNDLAGLHKLDSYGIVDRDRRDAFEVAYLQRKHIMVPDVAEIENIMLLPDIVRTMAKAAGADPERVFGKVKKTIINLFKAELRQQALQHTRHKVKRTVEYRVDARFNDIGTLERHLEGMLDEINPRSIYDKFCQEFHKYVANDDYAAILRVFNQKSMLANSNVAPLCGFNNKDQYIAGVIDMARRSTPEAAAMRESIRRCLMQPPQQEKPSQQEKAPKQDRTPQR